MISSLLLANGNGFAQLSPAIEALGWTLLHFVWQAAALGLALACFLALARRASPVVRYLAGCTALALMALAATGTFAWQMAAAEARATISIATTLEGARAELPPLDDAPGGALGGALTNAVVPRSSDAPHVTATDADHTRMAELNPKLGTPPRPGAAQATPNSRTVPADDLRHSTPPPQGVSPELAMSTVSVPSEPPILKTAPFVNSDRLEASKAKLLAGLQVWLPWIVGLWTCGVGLLAVRLAVGWGIIRRLKRQGEAPKDRAWNARLERLRVRLGVSAPVRLLCSTTATVPMVIGWLRPVVLVPAGLLAGLTSQQLEAVLAHELAHIRRHDYLVNLLQNIVETFFFYHPAVWWVTRQIRTEREHCCDDLAAAICGSTLDYARALTALAELRNTSGVFGLAATGGSLVNRIARLAGVGNPEPRLGWPFPALLLVAGAAIAFLATHCTSQSNDTAKMAPTAKASSQSIRGRVLDPSGKPVAEATVWLAGPNGKGLWLDGLPILAKVRSSADGRFELPLSGPALAGLSARPRSEIQIWVRKPGFALAFQLVDSVTEEPHEVRLRPQIKREAQILNHDNSVCSNALVAPGTGHYGDDRFVQIPDSIADELKVRTDANGRVELTGMAADELTGVRVESAESGVQRGTFPNWEWPDRATVEIKLRKTGTVEGRLIVPKECTADLAQALVYVIATNNGRDSSSWQERFAVRPERDGRFRVGRVPTGEIELVVEVPEDWNYRPESPQVLTDVRGKRLGLRPGGLLHVDMSLSQWVRVSRTVRDAQSQQPLPGVELYLCSEHPTDGGWIRETTDDKGRFAAWIVPNVSYLSCLTLPRGYSRANPGAVGPVQVASDVPERELESIELTRGRRVDGLLVDPTGRPIGNAQVGVDWRVSPHEPATSPAIRALAGVRARQWTKTDALGGFHFDDLPCDLELTFTPVHAGITLAQPLHVPPSKDRRVQIVTERCDCGSIAGRVVDRSGRPVPNAEVAVQIMRSKDIVDSLRLRTNLAGRYQSPAWFPQQSEYRVTVRSMCRDIASTTPRTLCASSTPFPDLVIDRPVSPTKRLSGSEVVAVVNGESITAAEVFERRYCEPLGQGQKSLSIANQEMQRGLVTEAEYRELQEQVLKLYLKEIVETRVIAQTELQTLNDGMRRRLDETIAQMFEKYMLNLQKDCRVSSKAELEQRLKRQGTSLASLRKEFRLRLLRDEFIREWHKTVYIDGKELENVYFEHWHNYVHPEQVRWQLLRIGFAQSGGRQQALVIAQQASAALSRGDDVATVFKKYSDAPPPPGSDAISWTKSDNPQNKELAASLGAIASGGILPIFKEPLGTVDPPPPPQFVAVIPEGDLLNVRAGQWFTPQKPASDPQRPKKRPKDSATIDYGDAGLQPWTNPANVAEPQLAKALAELEPGATSGVIKGSDSFFIVHLIERRPAGREPHNEALASIEQNIRSRKQDQMLKDLFERATIESPYLPDRKPNAAAAAYWTPSENAAKENQVQVDASARERELEPIELVRSRRVHGLVVDPSERPVGDVWVGANFRTTELTEPAQEFPEMRSVQLQRPPSRVRRIRIRSRSGNDFNMNSRPTTNRTPPEQVTILTGGVTVLIEGLDQRVGGKPVGTIELSADRMVIWSRGELAGSRDREEGTVQSEDEPFDVYLEGNVVIFQGDPTNPQLMRKVRSEYATFDAREKKGLLLQAELEAYLPSLKGSVRIWSERIRQLGPNEFHATRP
jgi:beta-lactamase regulating signal transducer with metallopeptidase domain